MAGLAVRSEPQVGRDPSSQRNLLFWVAAGCIAALLAGCSSLNNAAQAVQPRAKVLGMQLADINVESVAFNMDLEIENPNPVQILLSGFDYDLSIEGQSLISGIENKEISIPAGDSGRVNLPIRLEYASLANIWEQLKQKDEFNFNLTTASRVQVPVLGQLTLPATLRGQLPIVRLPKVEPSRLRVTDLKLTSATLMLDMEVENPNAFAFALEEIDYALAIGGRKWAESQFFKQQPFPEKSSSTLSIPVNISFLNLGLAAYDLIKGSRDLDYEIEGHLNLTSGKPFMRSLTLPLENRGRLPVVR